MSNKRKISLWLGCALVLCLAALGGFMVLQGGQEKALSFGDNPNLPTLTFYTTAMATTPQMPFWAAVEAGEITKHCNLKVKLWKDLDSLRATILAGKGDLWLGHVEGFAQARMRGADLSLFAVTGWRKLFFLSNDPEFKNLDSLVGLKMPFTPIGSPGVPVMRCLQKLGAPKMDFEPYEPKRLAMSLAQKKVKTAFAPEPLVSLLLAKNPGLRIVANLEDLYGKLTGKPNRMPIAGLAMNQSTMKKYPHLAQNILAIMKKQALILAKDPAKGIDALPESFAKIIPRKIALASLKRDLILVKSAKEVEPEIASYLSMIQPEAVDQNGDLNLGPDFLAR